MIKILTIPFLKFQNKQKLINKINYVILEVRPTLHH